MANLTEKQQRFVDAKVGGVPNGQAAILAGYARTSAAVTAAQLMGRPDIKAAIRAGKKSAGKPERDDPGAGEGKPKMKEKYTNSLELMQHTYNNPTMPFGVRIEAAKTALPYEVARIGEQGKKEAAKGRAKDVSKGRFGAKQPPTALSRTH